MSRSTRAIRIEKLGPPEVLVEREVPLADPGPGQLQLRVEAAGVNFADLIMRLGMYRTVPPRPFAPGFEVAGVIERLGPGTEDRWKVGTPVVALMRYGGYSREVIVEAANTFPRLSQWDAITAAAIPVVFLTAWAALFEGAHARSGQTALVTNAGGGVGTAAVQLAVAEGLRVYGTAGTPVKRSFVVDELGAVDCFDSRGDWYTPMKDAVGERGLDIALDSMGGDDTKRLASLLAPLGHLAFYGMSNAITSKWWHWPKAAWTWLRMPRFHPMSLMEPCIGVSGVHLLHLASREDRLREAFNQILQRFAEGKLRAVVDSTFPLTAAGAAAAHRRLHDRQNLGKVVLVRED